MANVRGLWGALTCIGLLGACQDTGRAAEYSVVFDDAAGLKPGAKVFIAGVQVGRVNQVELEGVKAKITFSVRAISSAPVTSTTCAGIGWYGPGGDAHLSVEPGDTAATPVAAEAAVTACAPKGLLGKSGEDAMAKTDQLLSAALNGPGLISRLLKDKKLADRFEQHFTAAPGPAVPPDDNPQAGVKASATPDGGVVKTPTPPKPTPTKPRSVDPGF